MLRRQSRSPNMAGGQHSSLNITRAVGRGSSTRPQVINRPRHAGHRSRPQPGTWSWERPAAPSPQVRGSGVQGPRSVPWGMRWYVSPSMARVVSRWASQIRLARCSLTLIAMGTGGAPFLTLTGVKGRCPTRRRALLLRGLFHRHAISQGRLPRGHAHPSGQRPWSRGLRTPRPPRLRTWV